MRTKNPEYLTLQEAVDAGYAGYSTLRKYIAEDRLPALKVGRRVKIRHEDLENLLVEKNTSPTEGAIAKLVEQAPKLSREQITKLSQVLATAGGDDR